MAVVEHLRNTGWYTTKDSVIEYDKGVTVLPLNKDDSGDSCSPLKIMAFPFENISKTTFEESTETRNMIRLE